MSALEKLKNKNTPPTELELCILMAGSLESPEKAAEQLEYLVEQNKMFLDAMNTLRDKLDKSEDELAALRERVAALEWVVKKLEYIEEYPSEEELCPICRAEKPTHYEDCELHAALQESK